MKISLFVLRASLFSSVRKSYLDVTNGRCFDAIPDELPRFKGRYYSKLEDLVELPQHSYAHLRQAFFRKWISDPNKRAAICQEYQIDDSITFDLVMDVSQDALQSDYIKKTHWLFEDNRMESTYLDYELHYGMALAILYCVEHGYEWEEYTIHRT